MGMIRGAEKAWLFGVAVEVIAPRRVSNPVFTEGRYDNILIF